MKTLRIIALLAAPALLWSWGCAKDLVTGKQTYNWYTIQDDIQLGERVMAAQKRELRKREVRKDKDILDSKKNREELDRLRRILKRIRPVTHYPQFPYEVHLADLEIANAWCAPGGKVMVFEGLWDPKKGLVEKGNEAELAAVLSHEIAHANARHVTEAVSRGMTLMMVGTAATAGMHAGAGSQAAAAFSRAASLGINLYFPMYTRDNETEADKIGLIYMAKAGYDPRVAVSLWERAAKKKGDRFSIFASHPSSGMRAQTLKDILPEALQYYEAARKKKK